MKFSEYILNEGLKPTAIREGVEDSFEFQDLYCTAALLDDQIKKGKVPGDVKDKIEKILIRIYAALASRDLKLIKQVQKDMFKAVNAAAKKANAEGAVDESMEDLREEPVSVATVMAGVLCAKGVIAGAGLLAAGLLYGAYRVSEPIIKDYNDHKYKFWIDNGYDGMGNPLDYSVPAYLKTKAKKLIGKVKSFVR